MGKKIMKIFTLCLGIFMLSCTNENIEIPPSAEFSFDRDSVYLNGYINANVSTFDENSGYIWECNGINYYGRSLRIKAVNTGTYQVSLNAINGLGVVKTTKSYTCIESPYVFIISISTPLGKNITRADLYISSYSGDFAVEKLKNTKTFIGINNNENYTLSIDLSNDYLYTTMYANLKLICGSQVYTMSKSFYSSSKNQTLSFVF